MKIRFMLLLLNLKKFFLNKLKIYLRMKNGNNINL